MKILRILGIIFISIQCTISAHARDDLIIINEMSVLDGFGREVYSGSISPKIKNACSSLTDKLHKANRHCAMVSNRRVCLSVTIGDTVSDLVKNLEKCILLNK